METTKVSVIIACYNVNEYIGTCLESLINNNYNNIEIICVNDGSTDNTQEILEHYAKCDSRIIVINKPNGGAGSARNVGILHATGEYVCFPDADDTVCSRYISEPLKQMASYKADYCIFGWEQVDTTEEDAEPNVVLPVECYRLMTNKEIRERYLPRVIGYGINDILKWKNGFSIDSTKEKGMAWRCIYKLSIIKEHNLKFKEGRFLGEDRIFNSEYCLYANRMISVNEPLYKYKIRLNGLYKSSFVDDFIYRSKAQLLQARNEINSKHIQSFGIDITDSYAATNVLAIMEMSLHAAQRKQWSELKNILKAYCSDNIVLESISRTPYAGKIKFDIPLFLIKKKAFKLLYVLLEIAVKVGMTSSV